MDNFLVWLAMWVVGTPISFLMVMSFMFIFVGFVCYIAGTFRGEKSPPEESKSQQLQCLYCHGTSFYEGPSGGMSTNILCANNECRHWFNYTALINKLDDLNRVEPPRTPKE